MLAFSDDLNLPTRHIHANRKLVTLTCLRLLTVHFSGELSTRSSLMSQYTCTGEVGPAG